MWLLVHKLNTFSQFPCKVGQVHFSLVESWCVCTSMPHFIIWMEEHSKNTKLCFKMKSYHNYNCHINHMVMQNNQSYIIITFTLEEDTSLGHPSTSYSTGILLIVPSTTAELAEDGVCIGSEWHSITYK